MNIIAKPSKYNLKTYLPVGSFLIIFSFLVVILNAFFNLNLISFAPSKIDTLFP